MHQPRILRPQDLDAVIAFEKARAERTMPDEADRELASWHASWRKESLEHYLPLGWSFGLWQDNGGGQESAQAETLVGYFISQPHLFMRGLTQTLWVERLAANTTDQTAELIEIAYRMSREKHFQKVLFHLQDDATLDGSIFQLQKANPDYVELKTAKF